MTKDMKQAVAARKNELKRQRPNDKEQEEAANMAAKKKAEEDEAKKKAEELREAMRAAREQAMQAERAAEAWARILSDSYID